MNLSFFLDVDVIISSQKSCPGLAIVCSVVFISYSSLKRFRHILSIGGEYVTPFKNIEAARLGYKSPSFRFSAIDISNENKIATKEHKFPL